MNPFSLSASDLLIWGVVLHLIADWPLQNEWMATNKMLRRLKTRFGDGMSGPMRLYETTSWWDRHPAAYVHAGIHGLLLSIVFGWVAIPLAIAHLIIDCRWPVAKWSWLMGQTQPPELPRYIKGWKPGDPRSEPSISGLLPFDVMYVGTEVRFWNDQVFHIICVAIAAVLVTL
jgi:hypothetical protein